MPTYQYKGLLKIVFQIHFTITVIMKTAFLPKSSSAGDLIKYHINLDAALQIEAGGDRKQLIYCTKDGQNLPKKIMALICLQTST